MFKPIGTGAWASLVVLGWKLRLRVPSCFSSSPDLTSPSQVYSKTIPKKWNFGATVRPLLFDPSANCLYVWGSSCSCCMSGDALVGEVLAIGWVMLMNDFLELWMDQVFEKDFFKVSRLGCNPTYLWDTLHTESWVPRLPTCSYVDENEAVFPLSEDTDAATVAIVEKHLRRFDYGTVL